MHGSYNRVPLLAAIFMALVFAAFPGPAEAQQALTFPAAAGPQLNCAGYTGVGLCQCQMINNHQKRAQDLTIANMKIIQNTNIMKMETVYCLNTVLIPLWNLLNAFTTTGGGGNPFGVAISTLLGIVVQNVIFALINQVCQMVAMAAQSAINFIKNLTCIPIPSFNLSLNGGLFGGIFKNGTCNNVNLFNLVGTLAMRPQTPFNWQEWNVTPGMTIPMGNP